MEITIKKKNVEEVDRYLKSFLKQKSLTEDEIRNMGFDISEINVDYEINEKGILIKPLVKKGDIVLLPDFIGTKITDYQ